MNGPLAFLMHEPPFAGPFFDAMRSAGITCFLTGVGWLLFGRPKTKGHPLPYLLKALLGIGILIIAFSLALEILRFAWAN